MDELSVFVTTSLPKAGAQVAGLPLTLNLLLTAYVILRHSNRTLLMMQRFRIGRGLRSSVCVWSAIHVSRADVFRHVWQWFMKR